jgi:organic radical activating enzyme
MLDKKDYICLQPFQFSELFDYKTFMCCPQWLPTNLGDPMNMEENWNSQLAEDIRNSIIDGSYKFCIESKCPKLTGLKEGKSNGFVEKKNFNIDEYRPSTLKSVKFNFDQSCNLQCPSCRTHKINYEGAQRNRTESILKNVEEKLSKGLEHIECTGSGDPFFSRTFRKWMMEFNPKKYPKLKSIHLHTNATLWNKSNWERMGNIAPYINSAEISIDAATKETYEKVRLGGSWDDIQANLNYIKTLNNLKYLTMSFVVQNENYKEMKLYYDMICEIFKDSHIKWEIFYNRIVNWGTFTKEQFVDIDVSNPYHPNYNEMVNIYNKLPKSDMIRHNLELVQIKKMI